MLNQHNVYSSNVTGPAKIGQVGTNYTPSHTITYLSTGIEYLHSVTCILKLTKCVIGAENVMDKQ